LPHIQCFTTRQVFGIIDFIKVPEIIRCTAGIPNRYPS
jgi:hypothetical protein